MSPDMMKILIFLLIPALSFAQKYNDGIYLEMEGKRCANKKLRLLNTESLVCTSHKPFITADEFKDISPLEVDQLESIRKFSILLSEEGSKRLTEVSRIYLGKNFAFISDDQVICLMKVDGVITTGKVIVKEDLSDSSLKYIYKKIKDSIQP